MRRGPAGRTEEEGLLEFGLGVVQKSEHQTRTTAEPTEHGALAHTCAGCHGVHGDGVRSALVDQPDRGVEEQTAVARGVAALAVVGRHRQRGMCHTVRIARHGRKWTTVRL